MCGNRKQDGVKGVLPKPSTGLKKDRKVEGRMSIKEQRLRREGPNGMSGEEEEMRKAQGQPSQALEWQA